MAAGTPIRLAVTALWVLGMVVGRMVRREKLSTQLRARDFASAIFSGIFIKRGQHPTRVLLG